MKVTLIDYTGRGSHDPMYAARLLAYTKNTRLQGEAARQAWTDPPIDELQTELAYIANTIRSSWEFCQLTFEIQDVTRAFTHQLVRTRYGVSFAQQSQRSVDMSQFSHLVPDSVMAADEGVKWFHCMSVIADAYGFYHESIPAQDCRGLLPTNVLTNIIARFDLRAFADLCGKRDNLRAQGEYIDVVRAMKREVLTVWPWAEPFLSPERTATPALEGLLTELLGEGSPVDKPRLNAALKELDKLKGVWG